MQVCLSPDTQSYRADGYFTGVRSSVVVPQPAAAVFESLSRDLQLIFGPIQVRLLVRRFQGWSICCNVTGN